MNSLYLPLLSTGFVEREYSKTWLLEGLGDLIVSIVDPS